MFNMASVWRGVEHKVWVDAYRRRMVSYDTKHSQCRVFFGVDQDNYMSQRTLLDTLHNAYGPARQSNRNVKYQGPLWEVGDYHVAVYLRLIGREGGSHS